MGLSIERVEVLLLVAAIVAVVAQRIRLPYTVGLVVAGLALAFFPDAPDFRLTKELIFTAFLPPLIFEAAIQMPWHSLRRDLPVTLTLATLGVLVSATVTAAAIRFLVGWDWMTAGLVGVFISATDPVSVIATFKEAGVKGRLRLLLEAESLFNDGTVAVLFGVGIAAAAGAGVTAGGAALSFLAAFVGGLGCGLAVGGGALLLAGGTKDPLVEITFTTVAAYGSFLLADHFHVSGVLATLACGIVVGNVGRLGLISEPGREAVLSFWEYAAFVANSLIFLLIGLRLAHQHLAAFWRPAIVVIVFVTVGRAVAVYGCSALFARSGLRVERSHQHILFWGGLRGALALALVFGLPPAQPHRDAIVTVAFAVVAFSVLVQGLTITPLLHRLGAVGAQAEPSGAPQLGLEAPGGKGASN